jgi:hypothetical protein
MCSIVDVLTLAESSSNSNFLDSDNNNNNKGVTICFVRLRMASHGIDWTLGPHAHFRSPRPAAVDFFTNAPDVKQMRYSCI